VIASLTTIAEDAVRQAGLAGLTFMMALEHIFPPIPSEIVLPLAGFQVGRGTLTFLGALTAATLGSVIGATALFLLARRGGRRVVLRFQRVLRIDAAALDRAEQRFARHGRLIVFAGRLVPGLRSLVSLPPGMLGMPLRTYLWLTAAGSLLWNALLIGLGWQLGARWENVASLVGPVSTIVVAATLAAGLTWLYRRRRSPAINTTA
jgi:membrane protein DedA with SNARE-associated domain